MSEDKKLVTADDLAKLAKDNYEFNLQHHTDVVAINNLRKVNMLLNEFNRAAEKGFGSMFVKLYYNIKSMNAYDYSDILNILKAYKYYIKTIQRNDVCFVYMISWNIDLPILFVCIPSFLEPLNII